MATLGRLLLALTGSTLLLTACGVAASDDAPLAGEDAHLEVAVCKTTNDQPVHDLATDDFANIHTCATYDAARGLTIPFEIPIFDPIHPAEPTAFSKFNPVEWAIDVEPLDSGSKETCTGQPATPSSDGLHTAFVAGFDFSEGHVTACNGTVAIRANATIELGDVATFDTEAAYCAPDSVEVSTTGDGLRCRLKDGAKVRLTLRSLAPLNAFRTTTASLPMRARPASGETVLESIPQGTVVHQSGKAKNGFVSIRRGGREGWVDGKLLGPFEGTALTTAPLNVRELPSTQSPIMGAIPKGTRVQVAAPGAGQFQQIFHDDIGIVGYASGVFLTDPRP